MDFSFLTLVQFCNFRYNIPQVLPSEIKFEAKRCKTQCAFAQILTSIPTSAKMRNDQNSLLTNGNASDQVEHLPRCTQNVKLWSTCNKLLISNNYTTIIIARAIPEIRATITIPSQVSSIALLSRYRKCI